VLRRYTHDGLTPSRFDDVTGNASGYYLTDGLGSVTNIINATGVADATYRYSPYGTARTSTTVNAAAAANPLKYTGQQQETTGLYNLRARHYNPTSGRFTQTDPMPYGAGHVFEGAYAYAGNSPLVFTDPTGMRPTTGSINLALAKPKKKREEVAVCRRNGIPGLIHCIDVAYDSLTGVESLVNAAKKEFVARGYTETAYFMKRTKLEMAQNAYRHCLWSCKLKLSAGEDFARQMTDAHESMSTDWADSFIDSANNEIGFKIADRFPNYNRARRHHAGVVEAACKESLYTDELWLKVPHQ
jgi:RHS repeat-associated protein